MITTDPLNSVSHDAQRVRASRWWSNASHRLAREAGEVLESDGRLRQKLSADQWLPDSAGHTGRASSLMAWRGLWGQPRIALLIQAIDAGLAPPDDAGLDWWPTEYFRYNSLRAIFLPARRYGGGAALEHNDYAAQEAARQRLAGMVHERWPELTGILATTKAPFSPGASDPPNAASGAQVWRHPLVISARLGGQADFDRLAPIIDADPDHPLWQPDMVPYVLEAALKKRFMPLVEMALRHGANPHDEIIGFKGRRQTLLHSALASDQEWMVQWLLNQPTVRNRLETTDEFGRTPLLLAARKANVPAITQLVNAGAHVHARDLYGQSAAHMVIEGLSTVVPAGTPGQTWWAPKSSDMLQAMLVQAGQALALLSTLGLAMDEPASPEKKRTRKKAAADQGADEQPRRPRRSPVCAKPGETWEQQLHRRVSDDDNLDPQALAWLQEGLLKAKMTAQDSPAGPPGGVTARRQRL